MSSQQPHLQIPSKQLRSQLRNVMSHRVMRITRECSKQQQQQQGTRLETDKSVKLQRLGSFNLTQTIISTTPTTITPPKKLADKASLIEHCRSVYREAIDKDASIVQTGKSIIEAIVDYSKENSLEIATTVDSFLKENMFKTNQKLKQIYNNEASDQMKAEAQIQIILQIENYILSNTTPTTMTTVKVDEDFIWELANTVRWLSQTFKQRFKIEKFLFGEIYATYHGGPAVDIVQSLMEELGYDKDDDDDDSDEADEEHDGDKENDSRGAKKSPFTSPSSVCNFVPESQESVDGGSFNTPVKKAPVFELYATKESSSLSTTITTRVSCLFEDTCSQSNDIEPSATNFFDDLSQASQTGGASFCYTEDSSDLLDEFKRKKLHCRSNSFSLNSTTINRSIVVQRKRTKLKIRSPHKSPSKRMMMTHQDIQRKSPRIRDKQILLGDNDRKRPRSYLVTDTPDHKQNATILTIKQEKIRKRFSICNQSQNSPIVPETPVKDDDGPLVGNHDQKSKNDDAPKIISMSSRYRDLMFSTQRSFSLSPKKSLLLRK